jgi:hypothetical protein
MTVEEEARAALAAADAVLVRNDADLIAAGLDDGWVYVDADGITTKAELIGWIRSGRLAHFTMETVGDERVARVGDAVVITARRRSTGAWEGTPYGVEEWITAVFARGTDGVWRAGFAQKSGGVSIAAAGTSS